MAKLRLVKSLMTDGHYKERIEHAIKTSKEVNWLYWYDGYPVTEKMMGFLSGVKDVMPNVTFFPAEISRADSSVNTQNLLFYLVNEFSVCMDGQPFDLGRIGYRDYGVKANEKSYGVYSRKINNPKYQPRRDQFYMVMTNDVKKAIKNVCKYVVPYTHREIATAFYDKMHSEVESIRMKAQERMMNVARLVSNDRNAILAELLHLRSLGVQFKTEAFQTAIGKVAEAVTDAQEQENRNVKGLFVRVYGVGDEQYVDVIEADDIGKNLRPKLSAQPTTYAISELPEDLAGSISVLSILTDRQYVTNVGLKIDDNMYWVERG